MSLVYLKELLTNGRVAVQHFTWQRNFICGAGLAYACANEKYWHLPVAWLAPSMYVGYQAFKGRDQVRDFIVGRTYNHDRATAV